MTKQDACKIMNLSPGCSEEEIKKQYAALAARYHPEEFPKEFAMLHEAYETLMDRERAYEKSGMETSLFPDETPDDSWNDIFETFEEDYEEEQKRRREEEEALRKAEEERKREQKAREQKRRKEERAAKNKELMRQKKRKTISQGLAFAFIVAGVVLLKVDEEVFYECAELPLYLAVIFYILAAVFLVRGSFVLRCLEERYPLKELFGKAVTLKTGEKAGRRRTELILLCGICVALLCAGVRKDAGTIRRKHMCGDDMTWEFDGRLLRIAGSGDMWDAEPDGTVPWKMISGRIKEVLFEEGVESIGARTFAGCEEIFRIRFASTVKSIGDEAFDGCSVYDLYFEGGAPERIGEGAFHGSFFVDVSYPAENPTWTDEIMDQKLWGSDDPFLQGTWKWFPFDSNGRYEGDYNGRMDEILKFLNQSELTEESGF